MAKWVVYVDDDFEYLISANIYVMFMYGIFDIHLLAYTDPSFIAYWAT